MSEKLMLTKHYKTFINWFNKTVSKDSNASETITWMSYMPKFNVITQSAYDITKFSFYTKSNNDHSTMQTSRVMTEGESLYFSSFKDKNHVLTCRAYFLGSYKRF